MIPNTSYLLLDLTAFRDNKYRVARGKVRVNNVSVLIVRNVIGVRGYRIFGHFGLII